MAWRTQKRKHTAAARGAARYCVLYQRGGMARSRLRCAADRAIRHNSVRHQSRSIAYQAAKATAQLAPYPYHAPLRDIVDGEARRLMKRAAA